MTDPNRPIQQPSTGTRIRVTVTACGQHPDVEPTMPAATCSACGQQLEVQIGTPSCGDTGPGCDFGYPLLAPCPLPEGHRGDHV